MERILVLYLSIGSGHQVAAEAIAGALRRMSDAEVICRDPIAEGSRAIMGMMNLANSLSGLWIPQLYTRMWSNGRAGPIAQWLAAHGPAANRVRFAIHATRPDRIVCTHALPALIATRDKDRSQYTLVGVLTDFGAHAYWPHRSVDRYCVPAQDAAAEMIGRGIEPDRIHVTGLPIHSLPARAAYTDRSSDRSKVLILVGGRRAGPYRRAAQIVTSALPELDRRNLPIEVTIVTGANHSADRRLRGLALRQPIELLGLVDDLPFRLAQCDVVIGKPGGVITAEALAAGAALVALTPGPGQETANANFLRKHELAMICDGPTELVDAIAQLALDTDLRKRMQQAARSFGRPNAAEDVAQIVLNT